MKIICQINNLVYSVFFSAVNSTLESLNFTDDLQQWLSGIVLDLRPRGCGLEPHRCHCVVVLEQDTFICSTQEDPSLFN